LLAPASEKPVLNDGCKRQYGLADGGQAAVHLSFGSTCSAAKEKETHRTRHSDAAIPKNPFFMLAPPLDDCPDGLPRFDMAPILQVK